MSGKFNVFDEWSNKVGEYTPTGGSGADGFIMFIALLFLWTVGFLIYTLFRLIGQGIKEARLGNWNRAFGYLLIPILLLLIVVGVNVNEYLIQPQIKAVHFKLVDDRARDEAAYLESNPVDIKITKNNEDLVVKINNRWKKDVVFGLIATGLNSVNQYEYVCSNEEAAEDTVIPAYSASTLICKVAHGNDDTTLSVDNMCVTYRFSVDSSDLLRQYYEVRFIKYCQDL